MRLQDALQAFLLQLSADGRSPHTIGQYRRHVTALIVWISVVGLSDEITDLTPETLARFFAGDVAKTSCRGGPKKAVSLNAMRTSLRCFCGHLHDAGLVSANPARLLRRARCAPPPPKALHPNQQRRLLEVLATVEGEESVRDRMLVELLLGTGIRIGSAVTLDVEDIELEHGEVALRMMKNDRPCTAVLPASLMKELQRFLGGRSEGPIFLAQGRRISIRHAQRKIAHWLAVAGIDGHSAHSLRHSYACRLLSRTGDLRLVQAALNHASIVSTTIYTQVDRARLRAAIGG